MSDTYEYGTRKNGEVEILHNGSLAKLLQGDEAEDFLAKVKDGNKQQVLKSFAGAQSSTGNDATSDQHPALEDSRPGPVPHGDGEIREKDGQESP